MVEGIVVEPKQTFWIMTIKLLGEAAAIEWCKIFGSRGDHTHWTQVVPKDQHKEVRAALLRELNFSEKEWEAYRASIVDYRDQMVAHHDLDTAIESYPHYDKALMAANFMFDRLRGFADPDCLGGIPPSLDRWSSGVAGNMSAIVRAAFGASARLGPNVSAR